MRLFFLWKTRLYTTVFEIMLLVLSHTKNSAPLRTRMQIFIFCSIINSWFAKALFSYCFILLFLLYCITCIHHIWKFTTNGLDLQIISRIATLALMIKISSKIIKRSTWVLRSLLFKACKICSDFISLKTNFENLEIECCC